MDPGTILGILQFVGAATVAVYGAIDKALELEHEERGALKDLRESVRSLKSDTMVYKVLLNAMANDTGPNEHSPFTIFIQK